MLLSTNVANSDKSDNADGNKRIWLSLLSGFSLLRENGENTNRFLMFFHIYILFTVSNQDTNIHCSGKGFCFISLRRCEVGAFSYYAKGAKGMRGIEEFTKELAEKVQERLSGVEVTPMENLKNNGVVVHGLTFRRVGDNVAPTLYLEELFKKFKNKRLSVNDILEQIICTYQELDEPNIPDMDEYLSSPELINRINLRLLNLKKNRRMIEERNLVFYKIPNTDMVCLFYIVIKAANNRYTIGEIALSETLRERYLPTFKDAKELYEEVSSKVSINTISLEPVAKFANKIIKARGFNLPPIPLEANFLHVLTNDRKMFGASVLLTEAGRRLILERFPNGKLTILPSSIHETLIMETENSECIWMLQEMVREINATEVDTLDYLSDCVYHYDAITGELVKANVDESEVEEE